MGHQLWTSRITGYRRRGTRLDDLRSFLGGRGVTQTILEPLQSIPIDGLASEFKEILDTRGFDVAGVKQFEDGPVLGFVFKEEMQSGRIRDCLKPINAEDLISDATQLADLFTVLRKKERAFVLIGPSVRGIVTRSDLNKPPVRIYLFGLISLLEMHMQFWVNFAYPAESWKEQFSGNRLAAAKELQDERRKRDEAVTLLDCTQFCDKASLLVGKLDLITKLNLASKNKARSFFGRAERHRNDLAHSQLDLAHGTSWELIIELVEKIENAVRHSDEAIEREVSPLRGGQNDLWAGRGEGR